MEENKQTFETILTKLLEKIDKPSIKNSLKDSIVINKITSDGIYLITISKVAQLIFSNKENMRYIEEKLSEVMGSQLAIHVTFENKDSYFARKLESL
ncbi:MAG: hypothetical protein WC606_05120 [Candidatus Absconditabacterales bacterium]|jgi:K+-transporting ATPase c subunit